MVYALFKLLSMVDVYMTGKRRVALLIYLDHCIEQSIYALSCTAYSRNHRHTQQPSELPHVKLVTFRLKLIIHIEGQDHTKVHVYQLGGQIKVALKIRSVDDIDDHIGHIFDQVLPDIEFFRTVCRQGICSGQVDELEGISSVFECALLGIHSHTAVIAHMLMTSRSDIEKRCLSAVRIADQSHTDHLSAFFRQGVHLPLHAVVFSGLQGRQRLAFRQKFLGFCLTDDLYL